MNNAQQMYALNLEQITTAIRNGGNKRTILVQGHMGTGKSSLLKTLAAELPNHTPCYFDCTTKDLGDISIPKLATLSDDAGSDYVSYATNEELGVHLNKPIILMVDEYGKANPAVKNSMLRLMLERKIGAYELHPDSVVFATTNLGAEGVGDLLPPHARNRMTVITARKPDHMEWIEWGINNGVDHTLLGWCKDNPHLFYGFEDVKNPDDNPYIYHPKQQRAAFVTPRSLEAASDWLKVRDSFDDQTLVGLLMGTIGIAVRWT
jgi:energy-coupling factor transporter ATP-binding protein EcfA2